MLAYHRMRIFYVKENVTQNVNVLKYGKPISVIKSVDVNEIAN